jgi:seryl-tRNA synthetase
MLTISFIKENKEIVLAGLAKRNMKNGSELVEAVLNIEQEKREALTSFEVAQAELNKLSKEIGTLFQQGKTDLANELKAKTIDLKEQIRIFSEKSDDLSKSLQEILYKIPNIPHESVPNGVVAEDNEVVFSDGDIPKLHEGAVPHWDLASKYDIIDFELGNKITGAGFPVYKGKGAKLQRALISYFLDKNTDAGYIEMQPPYLVNEASGYGTGQLPDKEGQMYHCTEDNLYLIPTAEVPVTNFYRDVILKESDFPIKNTAYTPCFRREAGSYGAHVRGLNRLHQFDKVEIVCIEHPDKSYDTLTSMVDHVGRILKELKLPYRILRLCGGDMGFTSALTYDFEVFSTAQEKWLEVSSVSNFETFQANRLKLRFKDANGNNRLAHTLNGSSLALPRVLASILENYQTPEGIKVPEVLVKYTGFEMID